MYTRIKEKEGESNALSSTRWQQSHVLTCCYADPCCCAARMPQPVDHKLENHRPNDGPMSAFGMRYTKAVKGELPRSRGGERPVSACCWRADARLIWIVRVNHHAKVILWQESQDFQVNQATKIVPTHATPTCQPCSSCNTQLTPPSPGHRPKKNFVKGTKLHQLHRWYPHHFKNPHLPPPLGFLSLLLVATRTCEWLWSERLLFSCGG